MLGRAFSECLTLVLAGSAVVLQAQEAATPTCPLGHEPGYGRSLTPEQRAAQRAIVQQVVTELRAAREAGTITAEELAWLEQVEQRGGGCINGEPRGPRAGKGQGINAGKGQGLGIGKAQGNGTGFGHRRGARDGTGPRGGAGSCPQGNAQAKAGAR